MSDASRSARTGATAGFSPRAFRPAWWLPGAHAQTIIGRFLRPGRPPRLRRVRLETPDDDFLDLEIGAAPKPDAPTVLVLHGLEGHARSRYMCSMYRTLAASGIRPVGLNFRSCGDELNRAPRFYHSGETGDLRFVLRHLAERFPGAPLGAVGFSLGGNVLLKFLGEDDAAATPRLDAAVAVSVPFDLAEGADRIGRGIMGRMYTEYFLVGLRRKVRAKAPLLEGSCAAGRGIRARSLREFDDAVTAPLHGFADAADYYRRSSSATRIHRIRLPTLILHSHDDPFLPRTAIPREAAERNPNVTAVFTDAGGHQGFVSGRAPWSARFWAEEEAGRFLALQFGSDSPDQG